MSAVSKTMYHQVLHYIRQHGMLAPGDLTLVGVSGGVDSVVLLHLLFWLRTRLGIELHVAHLNHQFRGAEAERDAEFVATLAKRLNLPVTIASRDVPALIREKKLSPQDAGRQVRYEFFHEVAERVQARKIATAHHADDQAETVLIGLLRGVGVHGLGGIQPVLDGKIIRPLLSSSREQIEAFACEEGLEYVEDSSNRSRKYLRNRVRLDLLPALRQHGSSAIVKRLTSYAEIFQEDAFFIDKIVKQQYTLICHQENSAVVFTLDAFSQQPATIQRGLVSQAFHQLTGAGYALRTDHVRAVVTLFTASASGKRLALPQGVSAVRMSEARACLLVKDTDVRERHVDSLADSSSVEIPVPGMIAWNGWEVRIKIVEVTQPELFMREHNDEAALFSQAFDSKAVSLPLALRFRLPGDRFQPLGLSGKTRVKKFFIDRKVPRDKRNTIPIVIDKQGILWIVGYSIDERAKVRSDTKNIILVHLYAGDTLSNVNR